MPVDPQQADPGTVRALIDGLFGLLLALIGGAVTMLNKLANQTYRNRWGVVADLAASGFAGLMVFTLCQYFTIGFYLQAFFTGMAGHAGVRALNWLESKIVERFSGPQ